MFTVSPVSVYMSLVSVYMSPGSVHMSLVSVHMSPVSVYMSLGSVCMSPVSDNMSPVSVYVGPVSTTDANAYLATAHLVTIVLVFPLFDVEYVARSGLVAIEMGAPRSVTGCS